jgi:hypothetical protein
MGNKHKIIALILEKIAEHQPVAYEELNRDMQIGHGLASARFAEYIRLLEQDNRITVTGIDGTISLKQA